MLSNILERFVEESPVTVMAQSLMLKIFAPERLDDLFEEHAQHQYQQELLFSSQVDLMSTVVCGIHPSVHAAYRAKALEQSVSTTTLYKKLQGIEIGVSQALVKETAADLHQLIQQMGESPPSILPGYTMRIVDGTCLASTDHRPEAIRYHAAKALPGKVIAVFDPSSKLVLDTFGSEDGYTQERALFSQVLEQVKPAQVWVGDRNFCTAEFLTTINQKLAFFVIRQHGSLGWKQVSELQPLGKTSTGEIFEQVVAISYQGQVMQCRRVVLKLFQPTRDQEWEIAILTNLPTFDADAATVAQIYRGRWSIENLFQTVTENFNGEIQTLAYPLAALFSYRMAIVAYNILATIKAALGSVHGWGKIEAGISDYYLVDEIQGTYRGLIIALPQRDWQWIRDLSRGEMTQWLKSLASQVNLKRFRKTPRGIKKKRPPLIIDRRHRHVSTARLLKLKG